MNSLIFSLFVLVLFCFHKATSTHIARGRVRETICALWCVDALFSLCGTVISFTLYHYSLLPYLTFRNLAFGILYLILTALFVLFAPSGLSLLTQKGKLSEEEILQAEYSFNNTLSYVRSFLMVLLFGLPILFAILNYSNGLLFFITEWKEAEICGGLCFIAFLLLLPISLRQSIFWLKRLRSTPTEQEKLLIRNCHAYIHYQKRNRRL